MKTQSTYPSAKAQSAWWAHLESLNHTLARVLEGQRSTALNELERDHIRSLVKLLEKLKARQVSGANAPAESTSRLQREEVRFIPDVDIRRTLSQTESFGKWQKQAGIGFEDGVERLISSTERFLLQAELQGRVGGLPRAEFQVLRDLVGVLQGRSQAFLCTP